MLNEIEIERWEKTYAQKCREKRDTSLMLTEYLSFMI